MIIVTFNRLGKDLHELKTWCYNTFDKSLSDFHFEPLINPDTYLPIIRLKCKTEEEALLWTLRWK